MNNKHGIKAAISNLNAMKTIALALDSPVVATRKLALELLSVVCYVDPPHGHRLVLEAMDHFQNTKHEDRRFLTLTSNVRDLVNAFDNSNPDKETMEYVVTFMIFVNAIVDAPETMEFRVHLRNEFFALGFAQVLPRLSSFGAEFLHQQIQNFQDMMEEDYVEFMEAYESVKVEMRNPLDLVKILTTSMQGTESFEYLVTMLQYLLMIRNVPSMKLVFGIAFCWHQN